MISYYRKIIAEPFQRYKHNERCQTIMTSHSKVCIIQNNCCPLSLLNKLKRSLCNHSGGICRNQKQKQNTGFYNLQRSMTDFSRLYHRTMRLGKFHSGNNTFSLYKQEAPWSWRIRCRILSGYEKQREIIIARRCDYLPLLSIFLLKKTQI